MMQLTVGALGVNNGVRKSELLHYVLLNPFHSLLVLFGKSYIEYLSLQLFVFVHNFERNEWEVVTVLDSDGGSQAIYGINRFVLQIK